MTPLQLRERVDAAIQRENWAEAVIGLRTLARMPPQSQRRWIELSYVESFLGNYREARSAAQIAKRLPTQERQEVIDLLARLRTFNDCEGVREIASALLVAPDPDAGLLAACAVQLSNLNDHSLALDCAERAVLADHESIPARMALGQMRSQQGDVAAAEEHFSWCVGRVPSLTPAWWALSKLRRQTATSNHVRQLQALLSRSGLAPADVAYAAFALHKELDDLGDFEAAWSVLKHACAAKRATLRYDASEMRELVDALIASTSSVEVVASTPDRACEVVPVFIVGMHRSGTTLLEQLLDASSQVLGIGELYDFTSAMREATGHHCKGVIDRELIERARTVDFSDVGRRYLSGVKWRLGHARLFTDKLPSNFLNIGFICRALPQARILHLVRDPVETCFSNLRELFSEANPYSYDQHELADYFIQYRRLMKHWHAKFPGWILDVPYARLVENTESTMREVSAFCGIEYRDVMRDPRSSRRAVATASSVQVREGIVRREQPKWAPYAHHLRPLIETLRSGGVEVADAGF